MSNHCRNRRKFIKKCIIGSCGLALGVKTFNDFVINNPDYGVQAGFYNDAPDVLDKWSREADHYEQYKNMIRCKLCPHECILKENDRGFCRTRVVKKDKLFTVAYGNPCAVHIDPVEKKPLFHFLPSTSILSVATAGCNLRCLNCQNWEISQSRPGDTRNFDLMPENLAVSTKTRNIPSIAYTYSDPVIFYEYVIDSARIAKRLGIKNVLVTAGYVNEDPLREICKVVDAANVDLKSFNNGFYKKVSKATLSPVLNCLKVMREEGVWIEVTRLIIPTLSDDLDDIKRMCEWMVRELGEYTPLHLSRFHPSYKLKMLYPTPVETLVRASEVARNAGLQFVYVGNIPGHNSEDTICPRCKETIINREGYHIHKNGLNDGRCKCGEEIPGVWS
ncbi:MAG: AmmeMemoRadiSam system radical SAM enzyme [Candidatus Anammoxibacter sp.]